MLLCAVSVFLYFVQQGRADYFCSVYIIFYLFPLAYLVPYFHIILQIIKVRDFMKNGTVVDLKSFKAISFFRNNYMLLILCLIFVVGIVFGSFGGESFSAKTDEAFLSFFFNRHFGRSFLKIFGFTLLLYAVSFLLQFMFGASLMGVAVVPIITAFHGFWYGCVSSILYSQFTLKGVAFNATVLLPSFLVFVVASIFAARESMFFSLMLSRSTLPRSRPVNFYIDFKNYCSKFLFFSFFIVIAALIDALLSHTFLGFYNFTL